MQKLIEASWELRVPVKQVATWLGQMGIPVKGVAEMIQDALPKVPLA